MFLPKSTRRIDQIIVHYLGPVPYPGYSAGAAEIDRWHRERTPPFNEIGYHLVLMSDGSTQVGRHVNKIGAHCLGKNRHSIGIVLSIGIAPGETAPVNIPEPMQATLQRVLAEQIKYYPGAELGGHRDFANSKCPGFDLRHWFRHPREIRA